MSETVTGGAAPCTSLCRVYTGKLEAPPLSAVDTTIFTARYFRHCMQCTFCGDDCCSRGVYVDVPTVERLLEHATGLQRHVGRPPEEWFLPEWIDDLTAAGGRYTRTRVVDGRCVFLDRRNRGCQIHRYALEAGLDHHRLKPFYSVMYPLTVIDGVLAPGEDIPPGDFICSGHQDSLYAGIRSDVGYYYGAGLLAELDRFEGAALAKIEGGGSTQYPSQSRVPHAR